MSIRPSLIPALALAALAFGAGDARAQFLFPVTFDASAEGLSESERTVLAAMASEAGRRWTAKIPPIGTRSLEIEIGFNEEHPRSSGRSVTEVFVGMIGGRVTYTPGSASELITGLDPNGALPDIRLDINPNYLRQELWLETEPAARTSPLPVDRVDGMSVILHDMGHALAYQGYADGNGVPPPDYWSTFDRYMIAGDPVYFEGQYTVAAWGDTVPLTLGNIYHWGNAPVLASTHDSTKHIVSAARCEGLPTLARGAVHAKGDREPELLFELMNGVGFEQAKRYYVSGLDTGVLADIGIPIEEDRLFGSGFEG